MPSLLSVADAIFGELIDRAVLTVARDGNGRMCLWDSLGYSEAESRALIECLSEVDGPSDVAGRLADRQPEHLPLIIDSNDSGAHVAGFAESGAAGIASWQSRRRHACVPLPAEAGAAAGWLVVRLPDDADELVFRQRLRDISPLLADARAWRDQRYQAEHEILLAGLAESAPVSFLVNDKAEVLAQTVASLGWSRTLLKSGGRLRFEAAAMRGRLEAAIAAVSERARTGDDAVETIRVGGEQEGSSWVVVVRSLPRAFTAQAAASGPRADHKRATCWVALRGRELTDAPCLSQLRATFPLSAKEAELVRALLQGETVQSRAIARGVSENAERGHLKSIYRKTGCTSQSDLILLVAALVGPCFAEVSASTPENQCAGGVAKTAQSSTKTDAG